MKSVLVVEDSIDAQEFIIDWITFTLKGKPNVAATVRGAIDLLLQNNFDVIICDYQLLDGTGEEVLSYLRQHQIQTPTILFSGNSDLKIEVKGPLISVIKDKNYLRLFDVVLNLNEAVDDEKSVTS